MKNNNTNCLINIPQKKGDVVYFGIHDLSKYYRHNNSLPKLSLYDVFEKKGEIIEVNPSKHEVTISMDKTPFQFGYRKIESDKEKNKRFMSKENKIQIKIPIHYLQDITSLTEDDVPVYLVIDGNTKYQKNLINAIRRREEKRNQEKDLPKTRHYDDYEGNDFTIEDEEEDKEEMYVAHFDPSILSKSRNWKMFTETKRYRYY